MNLQVTDACAPRVTASPFYTCRRHKRAFRPPRYRRPTAHPVRMVEAVEQVACHVFNLADRDGQSISMEMVRTRLDRLRETHGAACATAANVAPADVYRIAKAWQWQTTASRLRALLHRDAIDEVARDRIRWPHPIPSYRPTHDLDS